MAEIEAKQSVGERRRFVAILQDGAAASANHRLHPLQQGEADEAQPDPIEGETMPPPLPATVPLANCAACTWTDGSTWVWTSQCKVVGRGEGSSEPVFDGLLPRDGENCVLSI